MTKFVLIGINSAYPTEISDTVSVLIEERYLIDCGTAAEREMRRFGYNPLKLREIYLSHLDADHWIGLPNLLSTFAFFKKRIKIYGPKGSEELVNKICNMLKIEDFPVQEIKENEYYKPRGDLCFIPFKTYHHGENYGYVIKTKKKKIIYSGDTLPHLYNEYKHSDILLHEATFLDRDEEVALRTGHSTVRQAIEISRKAKVNKLILYHFSPRYEMSEVESEIDKHGTIYKCNTEIGKPGYEYEL